MKRAPQVRRNGWGHKRFLVASLPAFSSCIAMYASALFAVPTSSIESWKWFPNQGGQAVIPYYFAEGINFCGIVPDCIAWQVQIHAAAEDWNALSNTYLESAFNLTYAGTLANGETPAFGIVFRRIYIADIGCDTEEPPTWTACGVELPNALPEQAPLALTAVLDDVFDYPVNSAQVVCIAINTGAVWGNGGSGDFDRRSTARHEIGHALGLGHVENFSGVWMSTYGSCGITTSVEDSLAIVTATCIYGPGPCETVGGFFGIDCYAITTNGMVRISKGFCDCGATGRAGALTYELALSEAGGSYEVFATLQESDWIDGRLYEHGFQRGYESAKFRMQVFDGSSSQVGEAFSDYPVDIPAPPANYALRFNGVQWAQVPHDTTLEFPSDPEGTFEMWAKFDNIPQDNHVIGKRSGCGSGSNFYQFVTRSAGSFVAGGFAGGGPGDGCSPASGPLIPGEWYHLAVSTDVDSARFYVNGAPISSRSCGITDTRNIGNFFMGTSGTCAGMDGELDNVAIWKVPLSAVDIAARMTCAIDPNDSRLVGYWTFDEDSLDQSIVDSSPYANDGFLGDSSSPDFRDPIRVLATHPEVLADCVTDVSAPSLASSAIELLPNIPNPFNPMTKLAFRLAEPSEVDLTIYAVDGRKIRTLASGQRQAGLHEQWWDGRSDTGSPVASGTYYMRLETPSGRQQRALTLLR